jgi:hypothetical protein
MERNGTDWNDAAHNGFSWAPNWLSHPSNLDNDSGGGYNDPIQTLQGSVFSIAIRNGFGGKFAPIVVH